MSKPIFDKKNVLVIGGAGFIGSHLCEELTKTAKVICLDNFLIGSERNIDYLLQNSSFEFIRHDITEPFAVEDKPGLEKFKATWQGIQEIYFMASPSARGDVERYPVETMMVNSVGLKNALELALKYESKFCYVSSDAVYGVPFDGRRTVNESTEGIVAHIDDHGAYAVAQRFGEAIVEAYRRNKSVNVRIGRVFNSYGPRMRLNGTRLIAEFTRKALNDEDIMIYGGSEALGTYCYVTDTVKGLIRLMEQGDEQPINIGSDQPAKLIDIAHHIVAITKSKSQILLRPDFPVGYRAQLVPNIGRAKEQLSWFPVTLLTEGLGRTIEDLKASKGLVTAGLP